MGLKVSYSQAKKLGLKGLHPGPSGEKELFDIVAPRPPKPGPDDGMTKLERSFRDDVLEPALYRRDIGRWWYEPVKLRLAGRTFYTPDWLVEPCPGDPSRLTFVETKGWMREDACVKIKVAAELYPCFRWLLVHREGRRGWSARKVDRNGIGRGPIVVPWIEESCR